MSMDKHIIFGVHITDRIHNILHVQEILTKYGCNIKTRLGLHEVSDSLCSANGLLILEMCGDEKLCYELFDAINAVQGAEAQKIVFDHP